MLANRAILAFSLARMGLKPTTPAELAHHERRLRVVLEESPGNTLRAVAPRLCRVSLVLAGRAVLASSLTRQVLILAPGAYNAFHLCRPSLVLPSRTILAFSLAHLVLIPTRGADHAGPTPTADALIITGA